MGRAAPQEAATERAEVTSAEEERNLSGKPKVGPVQQGRELLGGAGGAPPPGAGEEWACPVSECRESATHPLDNCKGFQGLSITKRRKMLKEWDRCEC